MRPLFSINLLFKSTLNREEFEGDKDFEKNGFIIKIDQSIND